MGAALLAHSVSRIIGVIVYMDPRSNETVFEDPFTGAMIGALEKKIRESGYYMMLYAAREPQEIFKLIQNWKLDGLLLFWVPTEICSVVRKKTDVPLVFIDQAVGRLHDVARRAVVAFELEEAILRVGVFEAQHVVDVGAAEGVDALRVVAHDADVAVLLAEALDDEVLGEVGVLILVD